jgi:large subunit ribosomal protein L24e
MVERRVCSFCGNEIEPGTGKMYIKIDGSTFNFCGNKCQKNLIVLKRVPRRVRWTQPYMREKSAKMSTKGKKASKKRKGKPTVGKAKKIPKKVSESEGGKDKAKNTKRKKKKGT